ncbi:MAG: hypothetical protein RI996_295 [Candidatus Parcubacteria bacterium]
MNIIKHKSIFLTISGVVIAASLLAVVVFGLKLGIDFTGGAQVQVVYTADIPESTVLSQALSQAGLGTSVIQPSEGGYTIKLRDIGESERPLLKEALSVGGTVEYTEKSFTSVGPSIGSELAQKAIIAIIAVVVAIICFIAFSFRHVSLPVASWKYGMIAITTLAHDIIIPLGLFAILGHYAGAEVDTLFVVALLTILGVSVSDTIVIFDRIRENLKLKISADFTEIVGKSLSQSFTRSINTSLTVVIVLCALFFFGPEPTKNFSLVLITGMIVGTYSSIFVASPLLVIVQKWQQKSNK